MLLFNAWVIFLFFFFFSADRVLQDECSFQVICSALDTRWVLLETKPGLSSL